MSGKRKLQYEDEDYKHILTQFTLKCLSLLFRNDLIQELQEEANDIEKQILVGLARGLK